MPPLLPPPLWGGVGGWAGGRVWRRLAASPDPHPQPLPTRGRGEGRLARCAILLLSIAAAPHAHAAWPDDRPIEIIVGYQAGSGPDILARRMAPAMAKHLGPK